MPAYPVAVLVALLREELTAHAGLHLYQVARAVGVEVPGAASVAVIVDDSRMRTRRRRHGYARRDGVAAPRPEAALVQPAALAAFLRQLPQRIVSRHRRQLGLGPLPECVEVGLSVGQRHHAGRLIAYHGLVDGRPVGLQVTAVEARSAHGHREVQRRRQRHGAGAVDEHARGHSVGRHVETHFGPVAGAGAVGNHIIHLRSLRRVPPEVIGPDYLHLQVGCAQRTCRGESRRQYCNLIHDVRSLWRPHCCE